MAKKIDLNSLNRQRSIDAASALWDLAVEKHNSNGMNCVCSFVPPAAFAAWLFRHECGDKTAQAEAVAVIA